MKNKMILTRLDDLSHQMSDALDETSASDVESHPQVILAAIQGWFYEVDRILTLVKREEESQNAQLDSDS